MSRARDLADLGDGIAVADLPSDVVTTASPSLGRRNLIINGAMQVAQRGTSSTAGGYNTVDRFSLTKNNLDQMGTTTTQSTDAPTGFSNALKLVGSPAETAIAADERVFFTQQIEAQNLQHLKFGTSSAESLTLSFWVKSDVTGNYAVSLYLLDDTRVIGSTYTISSADTWEYKTLTFVGDTTGVIDNDNGGGLQVSWYLMAGSNYTATDNTSWGASSAGKLAYGHTASFGTTDSDNWQITGVQLEVGSVASSYEHRSFGEELALCQRYYYKMVDGNNKYFMSGTYYNGVLFAGAFSFPVTMRTAPTLDYVSGTSYYRIYSSGTADDFDAMTLVRAHVNGGGFDTSTGTGGTSGSGGVVTTNNSNSYIAFQAEL